MTQKIVISVCHGGFGLSHDGIMRYAELKGINIIPQKNEYNLMDYYVDEVKDENLFFDRDILRDDPILVEVVKQLGESANGDYASLKIVEIPDDVNWYVEEYDGKEWVAERHRTWR